MYRTLMAALLVLVPLSACGDDESTTTSSPATSPTTSPTEPTTAATTGTTDVPAATTTSPSDTGVDTTAVPQGDQTLGLWPPEGAETPEDAAAALVEDVLGAPANLGEFRQGDARSGEIDVLGPEEGPGVRATALLRRLGPDDAWFVIGAASEGIEITSPETNTTVAPGSLRVDGRGRGFESTINVIAVLADDGTELDLAIGAGGPFGDLEPYEVTLDLSDAEPGDTVMLVARGDTGLSDDPGEFTAIGVTVG